MYVSKGKMDTVYTNHNTVIAIATYIGSELATWLFFYVYLSTLFKK